MKRPGQGVFISYSSHDKAWVRGELLKRVEQAGLKAVLSTATAPTPPLSGEGLVG